MIQFASAYDVIDAFKSWWWPNLVISLKVASTGIIKVSNKHLFVFCRKFLLEAIDMYQIFSASHIYFILVKNTVLSWFYRSDTDQIWVYKCSSWSWNLDQLHVSFVKRTIRDFHSVLELRAVTWGIFLNAWPIAHNELEIGVASLSSFRSAKHEMENLQYDAFDNSNLVTTFAKAIACILLGYNPGAFLPTE